jgi:predicted DCC family thiol-disulfide oxidoreductase YuxK
VSEPVLLFDGVCNLCNAVVQFVLRHDHAGRIQFASQQSPYGQRALETHGIPAMQGVVLIEGERVYTNSDAALRLLEHLGVPWRWAAALRVVPKPVREVVYAWIARNRYRLFGRREACMMPRPEWKTRFLDNAV